jgi:hypothetical protein
MRRREMDKMFEQMMQEFFKRDCGEDKQQMKLCCDKMAATFPCCGIKDMSDEDKKDIMKKMRSFCGKKMDVMSSPASCMGWSK